MTDQQANRSWIQRVYDAATAPKTIIITGFAVLILYIGLVAIGVLVAALTKPPYTILNNWISDLGSSKHTAVPVLYDLACIFAGTLTIPFIFYLERHITPIPQKLEDFPVPHRWAYRFMSMGLLWSLLGSIFYIGVGIFSGDRNVKITPGLGAHDLCSFGAFGGFSLAAIFLGFALVFVRQPLIPKPYNYPLGIWGIIGPITVAVLNLVDMPGIPGPILEWSLLFAILAWIVPLALFTLRHAEKLKEIS